MPTLHIHLLGDFRLVSGDAPLSPINSPRVQSLLAYLVLHRHAPQPRHHLAFQLWPDTTEAQARTNLRQLLHGLKQTLLDADQFVHADAQTLQWRSAAPFHLDVAEFEAAQAQADAAEQTGDPHALRGALEQAIALYGGELLPSCYDDWVVPERERLRQAFSGALERLQLLLESQGELRAAIAYAERAGALSHFWELRGYFSEGQKWLDDALALTERQQSGKAAMGETRAGQALRARALYRVGMFRSLCYPTRPQRAGRSKRACVCGASWETSGGWQWRWHSWDSCWQWRATSRRRVLAWRKVCRWRERSRTHGHWRCV